MSAVNPQDQAGFVALIGASNVGKSTLLNQLVGSKVSIVSPKVQTTRRRIIGITIRNRAQIMFVDTPGIFAPRRRLDRAMVQSAWSAASDTDVTCIVIDAKRGLDNDSQALLTELANLDRPILLAINKIDLIPPEKLLPLIDAANKIVPIAETLLVSALSGEGCDELMAAVVRHLPNGPWLFPEDQLSDLSQRAMAAEITREQVYLQLHQELPYAITVETEGWAAGIDGGEVRIDQIIYVQRSSQKGIILGKGGRQIKAIGEAARKELEALLETRVHLFLFVKVRERCRTIQSAIARWVSSFLTE